MLSEIKNRILSSLEGGGFQDLCDSLLYAKGYKNILQLGMKAGTLKTTIGNPDTYFRGDSGKYVFVAYTTVQKDIYRKIREDIEKCLDENETGVNVKDIEKIICCHTSSSLKAGEDQNLIRLCNSFGVELELYGVDEIANEIYRDYPYLAKDKLNLSLDSNQIFPREEFIKKYDSANRVNAPLNTIFQYREDEKKELLNALENEKAVVVLGNPGVGKSRLALEVAKEYEEQHNCKLLCIKCNQLPITEDLCRYITKIGKYLIFVDDANYLTGLRYLLEYIVSSEDRYDVRIIMTVRDYVSREVINEVKKITIPKCLVIRKFTDAEIREFIKLNLEIDDIEFLNQVVRIAQGNPRLAYMAGKLAKEKNDLMAIMNVESLYENYYNCFLETTAILTDPKVCLAAGVISMFGAVNLENVEKITGLLEIARMTKDEFIDRIYYLHSQEYVEIKSDLVAKISDQCLSNYVLYYAFFVKKLIRFSDLLRIGFGIFNKGIVDTVNTIRSIFYSREIEEYLAEEVREVWEEFKTKNRNFYEFVKIFHVLNPEDSLLYVNEKIELTDSSKIDIDLLEDDERKWKVQLQDSILGLLIGYRKGSYSSEAVELIINYCIRKQDIVKEVYSVLESCYSIDLFSLTDNYKSQEVVINKIKEKIDVPIIKKLFYQIAKHYLALSFTGAEVDEKALLTQYRIVVELSEGSKRYRSSIWEEIISLTEYAENAKDTFQLLLSYPNEYGEKGKYYVEEMKFDFQYILLILDILKGHLHPFQFDYICSRLLRVAKICSVDLAGKYEDIFVSDEWNLYQVLSMQFYRDTMDYKECERAFITNLKSYIFAYPSDQMDRLFKGIINIVRQVGSDRADINRGVSSLCEILYSDKERLLDFTYAYFKYGEIAITRPIWIVNALLKYYGNQNIQNMIWNANFLKKRQWQMAFFEMIDPKTVTQENYQLFIKFIDETESIDKKDIFDINIRFLDKFKMYSQDIYIEVAEKIIEKVPDDSCTLNMYFSSLFDAYCYTPDEILKIFGKRKELLKFIYFECLEEDRFTDSSGKILRGFISDDIQWVRNYASYINERYKNCKSNMEDYRIKSCWQEENYSDIFDLYFDELFCDDEIYGVDRSHMLNVLCFTSGDEKTNAVKEQWILHYIEKEYNNEYIVKTLFKILGDMNEEIRKKAILCFLKYNLSIETFKKLNLVSNSWSGINSIARKVDFLESLLPEIQGVKYLRHKKVIKDIIRDWRQQLKTEELENIFRELYR